MSDTPETDNAAFAACEVHEDCGVVYAEFAGQLERERNDLRNEINFTIRLSRTWEDDVKKISADRDYWKAEAERWRTTK